MKKLLRVKAAGPFLTDSGDWTQDKTCARDFFNHRGYLSVLEMAKSREVEWYYWFEDTPGEYDFTVEALWHALKRT